MSVFFTYRTSNTKCFFRSYVFVDCGYEEKRKSKSNIYCMSLRTAMSVFFTYRTSDTKCFFRSYVFVDCGYEEKRKSKSDIVCLCGLQ